jgi:hypothetical protein
MIEMNWCALSISALKKKSTKTLVIHLYWKPLLEIEKGEVALKKPLPIGLFLAVTLHWLITIAL